MEPTLFTDVDNSMTIAQEEIFGPVLVVIPFEDEDDAVRIANDSITGFGRRVLRVGRTVARGGPAHPHRRRRASTAAHPTARICRSAATSTAASGARTARPGFEQYLEIKSVSWPVG